MSLPVLGHTDRPIRFSRLRKTRPSIIGLLAAGILCWQPAALADPASSDYRAVILLIGDGFDDQHVTMGRNYLAGLGGELTLDTLPVRSAVQIETTDASGAPVYVADSANTATSLASGVITEIGRVGTDASDQDSPTVLERAAAAGYRTGIVSTASVTDATPASFMAHVSNRRCENPGIMLGGERYGVPFPGCPQDATSHGGPGSIAEQIVASPVDIVLGGGRKHFSGAVAESGPTVLETAEAQGITVIDSLDQAQSATGRVLGVFADSHLPVRWQGTDGRGAEDADTSLMNAVDARLGTATQPAPMRCEPNPDFGDSPTLAAMTEAALTHLDKDNQTGFFLMVESASIDKQSHSRNPCGSIGEIEQLEEALAVALAFAANHPDTLVLVTADHAQAAQIIPEPSLFDEMPVPIYSPGKVARIQTPEGGLMRINYATNNFAAEEHTGANVPLFGNATASGVVKPFMRQREVHDAMASFLKLAP